MTSTLQAIALYAEDTLSAAADPPTAEEQVEMLSKAIELIAHAACRDSAVPLERGCA